MAEHERDPEPGERCAHPLTLRPGQTCTRSAGHEGPCEVVGAERERVATLLFNELLRAVRWAGCCEFNGGMSTQELEAESYRLADEILALRSPTEPERPETRMNGESRSGWAAPSEGKPEGAWDFAEPTPGFTPGPASRRAVLFFPQDEAGTDPPMAGDCTTCGAPLIFAGRNPSTLQCPNPDCTARARPTEEPGE